uniref:G_PROTEIN_RECEP_F1_2 domain-containing protein n=1 Tax=Steinernema glaseri TaxID=37863 RepID=A0A1I8AJJ6_9BILA
MFSVFWYLYCSSSEVLALNRMLEFASRPLSITLFEGKRIYLWLLVVFAYATICTALVPDAFYHYDPYGGTFYFLRASGEVNVVHLFNNFFKFGFMSLAYGAMLFFMFRLKQRTDGGPRISTFQIKVSLQTLAIAVLADGVTMGYLAAAYLPLSPEVAKYTGTLGQCLWIAVHSILESQKQLRLKMVHYNNRGSVPLTDTRSARKRKFSSESLSDAENDLSTVSFEVSSLSSVEESEVDCAEEEANYLEDERQESARGWKNSEKLSIWKCAVCKEQIKGQWNNRRRHIQVHEGLKVSCPVGGCSATMAHHNLTEHLKKKHKMCRNALTADEKALIQREFNRNNEVAMSHEMKYFPPTSLVAFSETIGKDGVKPFCKKCGARCTQLQNRRNHVAKELKLKMDCPVTECTYRGRYGAVQFHIGYKHSKKLEELSSDQKERLQNAKQKLYKKKQLRLKMIHHNNRGSVPVTDARAARKRKFSSESLSDAENDLSTVISDRSEVSSVSSVEEGEVDCAEISEEEVNHLEAEKQESARCLKNSEMFSIWKIKGQWNNRRSHIQVHEGLKVSCPVGGCSATVSNNSLQRHLRIKHNKTKDALPDNGKALIQKQLDRNNEVAMSHEMKYFPPTNLLSFSETVGKDAVKPFCKKCGTRCITVSSRRNHVAVELNFTMDCPVRGCTYRGRSSALRHHLEQNHRKNLQDLCTAQKERFDNARQKLYKKVDTVMHQMGHPFCDERGHLVLAVNPDDPRTGRLIGIIYIIVGAIGISISGFVCFVFCRPHLFKHSCYKLVAITIAAGINNLILTCFVAGLASLAGFDYCSDDHYWFYLLGYYVVVSWYFYCIATVVLALNRVLTSINAKTSLGIFGGRKIWIWTLFMFLYALFGLASDPTYAFYVPNRGAYVSGMPSLFHVRQNSVIPALATLCYLVMLRYICKTYRTTGYSYHIASFGAALIGDLVTVFWMVTPYCSRNYPSLREYAMLMATASWTALHVGSGLLYLLTNKHVHRALKKVFRTPNALPFTASGSVQPSSI